jgi:hypothetical protein
MAVPICEPTAATSFSSPAVKLSLPRRPDRHTTPSGMPPSGVVQTTGTQSIAPLRNGAS